MGRNQLLLVDSRQMDQLGAQSFQEMKKQSKIDNSRSANAYVRCIADQLLYAVGENPQSWEVKVFVDDSLNAFALPGRKIGVHTGMLNFAKSQHQLAAVIGHEIGHVKAQHGNERVSQTMVTQLGLQATEIYLGKEDRQKNNLILAGLGLGAQFGVLLPFSRKHEVEADLLGVEYMSKAGFDPNGAVELWENMQKSSKSSVPEFFSTHPSNRSRILALQKEIKKYQPIYLAINEKPNCRR
ncbi:MAG: M48 family metallopeptidase [Bdellovibrionales bacterium]